jgi:hypothetical protein
MGEEDAMQIKQHRAVWSAAAGTLLFLLATGDVLEATQGPVLISQGKALGGNVTPGDAPGFPVTVSLPGSYRLTSNLTVPNADTTAIHITTDNVSLDLDGFSILGPVVCPGPSVECSASGSGVGIEASSSARVTVTNGVVQGMGSHGIFCANECRVERVHATNNAGVGVGATGAGAAAIVVCTANNNGLDGISVGNGLVNASSASFNGRDGISLGNGSAVENTATGNAAFGLNLLLFASYVHNTLINNNGGNENPQVQGGIQLGANRCGLVLCP